jgi:hypothetical protein
LETDVSENGVTFSRKVSAGIDVHKIYRLDDGEIRVDYLWINSGKESAQVSWCTISEVTPDYSSILVKGRKTLQTVTDRDRACVRNTASKDEIQLISDPVAGEVQYNEGLLALEVVLKYELKLAGESEQRVAIRMRRTSMKQRETLDT